MAATRLFLLNIVTLKKYEELRWVHIAAKMGKEQVNVEVILRIWTCTEQRNWGITPS